MLEVLQRRRHEIATCTFCPKLCRFACPVTEAECRETVTPWAMMTRLDDVRRGRATLDADTAELITHCTGCRRCEAVCKHSNDVAGTLYEARAAAVDLRAAPRALLEWAREESPETATYAGLPDSVGVCLMPGFAPESLVAAAVRLLRAVGESPGRADVRHAGARLHEAGLRGASEEHQGRVRRAFAATERVVCVDAGDAVALKGMRLDVEVLHLSEALAGRLDGLKTVLKGDVLYLDACRLGRGLGVYDEPRALLAQVVGGAVREAVMHHEEGGCCGSGAGYAAMHPVHAGTVAREAAADAPDLPVVTAGVSCVEHLGAEVGRPVHAWACLLAEGLGD